VPGRGVVHVSGVVVAGVVAGTSVENDWTRFVCFGGVPAPDPAMGQVTLAWALLWSGLATVVAVVPKPPPN
jgi:hypothetical protein